MNSWLVGGALVVFSLPLVTSCSDWLDVQPETQVRQDDMFSRYKGFQDALTGCYLSMADRNIYGQNLMMDKIEQMACLWAPFTEQAYATAYYFNHHQYTKDETQNVIKNMYAGLFNVIVQANNIIVHLEKSGNVITTERARGVIEAEAYALRAYCQFDVLRLFGQMPNNPRKTVSLPYAEKPSITDMPVYYSYADYVKKLEDDLNHAEQLFAQYDPAATAGFYADDTINDDFLTSRRWRMNLWAVKAMKARFYQYIGQTANAYQYAKQVIDATVSQGKVVELAKSDLDGYTENNRIVYYYALPTECLFALANSELIDYSISWMGGASGHGVVNNGGAVSRNNNPTCYLTNDMLSQLFAGRNLSANNRYLQIWEKNSLDGYASPFPTIKKYYYDTSAGYRVSTLKYYLQIMPMIRLSEMYLIAMECNTSLEEANALYKTYMASHSENITTGFENMDAVKAEVLNEYRREFIGEGVMFYTYKRLSASPIMWGDTMSDDEYVLPLPATEYESK